MVSVSEENIIYQTTHLGEVFQTTWKNQDVGCIVHILAVYHANGVIVGHVQVHVRGQLQRRREDGIETACESMAVV
jgi:hypothetical protein